MARKKKPESRIPQELIKQLVRDHYKSPADMLGPDGLLKEFTAAIVNAAMEAELTHHLGYESGEKPPADETNRRNGKSQKTVRTDHGSVEIETPRDREGSYEPILIEKHQREFKGFDDKILALYARGMSTRDIVGTIKDVYAVEISPDLVSRVADEILKELNEWQMRPLDEVYPVVWVDGLHVKIREKSKV